MDNVMDVVRKIEETSKILDQAEKEQRKSEIQLAILKYRIGLMEEQVAEFRKEIRDYRAPEDKISLLFRSNPRWWQSDFRERVMPGVAASHNGTWEVWTENRFVQTTVAAANSAGWECIGYRIYD